jgi:hypothetical protein
MPSGRRLEQSVSAWQQLRADMLSDERLEADENVIAEALADAGITDPRILLRRIVDACVWCERRRDEAKVLAQEYGARRDRYGTRAERMRAIIEQLADAIEVDTAESYLAKIRFQKGPASVIVPDVEALYRKFGERFVSVTKEARRTLLKEAINNGEQIDEAYLSNAARMLVISPKR